MITSVQTVRKTYWLIAAKGSWLLSNEWPGSSACYTALSLKHAVGIREEKVAGISVALATSQEREPPGNSGWTPPSLIAIPFLSLLNFCSENSKENNNRIKNNERLLSHMPVVYSL